MWKGSKQMRKDMFSGRCYNVDNIQALKNGLYYRKVAADFK